jgi:hypothetical protein
MPLIPQNLRLADRQELPDCQPRGPRATSTAGEAAFDMISDL